MLGILVGVVTAYSERDSLAHIQVRGQLCRGDHVHVLGSSTDFEAVVTSGELCTRRKQALFPGLELDVSLPPAQAGDMVFRMVGTPDP